MRRPVCNPKWCPIHGGLVLDEAGNSFDCADCVSVYDSDFGNDLLRMLGDQEIRLRVNRRLPPTMWEAVPFVLSALEHVVDTAMPPKPDPMAPKPDLARNRGSRPAKKRRTS